VNWRKIIFLSLAVALAGVVLLAGIARWSDSTAGEKESFYAADSAKLAGPVSQEMLARGEYLAKLGDCGACHSTAGQPAFSGGLKMALPIGAIYTTNITPDRTYGIGRFSLADFDQALRFGVANGHSLYPAMPYPSYAIIKQEDVAALYAYFKFGVAPAAVPNKPSDILFPLSMRWPLTYWRLVFAPKPKPFDASTFADATIARGAYFVEGLGHCGECHTPRGLALQVKAQGGRDGNEFLSGAPVENWYAPSLRSGGPDTIGEWSESQIARFLRTGVNHSGIAFGSMSDVIFNSTQYLTAEDAVASAKYLKTLQLLLRRITCSLHTMSAQIASSRPETRPTAAPCSIWITALPVTGPTAAATRGFSPVSLEIPSLKLRIRCRWSPLYCSDQRPPERQPPRRNLRCRPLHGA
jgi:alcohol dehydrogenase (quinone), cytochrome c subunit